MCAELVLEEWSPDEYREELNQKANALMKKYDITFREYCMYTNIYASLFHFPGKILIGEQGLKPETPVQKAKIEQILRNEHIDILADYALRVVMQPV